MNKPIAWWCSVVGRVGGEECLCNGHGHFGLIPVYETLPTPESSVVAAGDMRHIREQQQAEAMIADKEGDQ